MIQNAVAGLVFNEPKRVHVTPLFISLHWLPVAAFIKFKTLMLAYRTTTGSAPTYLHWLLLIYIPSRSQRSASERRLMYHHREAQNNSPVHSRSPFPSGGIIFPPLSAMLDPCQSSNSNWKLISFDIIWLHPKRKKIYIYLSLLPLLSCTLNNAWDLVLRAIPLSVCLFKINRFMYSPIVSRFGQKRLQNH